MGMFRTSISDPLARAQRDLASAQNNRASLNGRLAAAEAAATTHRQKARQLAGNGGADDDLDRAEIEMRRQEDRVLTLRAAIGDVDKVIGDLESNIADLVDDRQRAETAKVIDGMIDRWSSAAATFDSAAAELEAISRETAPTILDGHALASFAMSARQQAPAAIGAIVTGLRNHRAAVVCGTARATLPQAEKPAPRPVLVAPPKLQRIFPLRHLKFTDVAGNLRCAPKMNQVDVSPEHAALALANAWAIPLNDPRVRGLSGTFGAQVPDPRLCCDLDNGQAATATPLIDLTPGRTVATPTKPQGFGQFEVVDRGPAITGLMKVTPVEPLMAATRSLPDN